MTLLETLLQQGRPPTSLELFELMVAQIEAEDPSLAEMLWACAIPVAFNATLIGVLRDVKGHDDDKKAVQAENERLLTALTNLSFVLPRDDGDYHYHDETRDAVLQVWQTEPRQADYQQYVDRLVAYYTTQGEQAYWADEDKTALRHFSRALTLQPDNGLLYSWRGHTQTKLGQYVAAITDLEQAVQHDAATTDTYFSLGVAHYYQQEYPAAIEAWTAYLDLNPDDATVYYNRGCAYDDLGQYEQAIADYAKAIRLNPDYADAYNNRGIAYRKHGQQKQAIADYDEAIRLKPDDATVYYNRGVAYSNLGQYEQAIADYTEAIRLNPDYATAYTNRGLVYHYQGDYEQAIANYDEAIRLKPDYADAYNNRGNSYSNLGQHEQAIADYTEAIRLKPDDADAYTGRGVAYRYMGNINQAIADFDEAIRLKPDDALAHYNKACSYSIQGQVAPAVRSLRQALELDQANGSTENRDDAQTDSDFDPIRTEPEFVALLEQFGDDANMR